MRDFSLPGRSPVIAENGMAATSHPLGTMSAISVLRDGGNAVDAAIAAVATLCVVEPGATGIGGDCFAIIAEPDGTLHGLNASGRSSMSTDAEAVRARGLTKLPEFDAVSVTVPGALAGWEATANRFGTMGFDRLLADAIRYGEEGFAVHPRVASDWKRYEAHLAADPGAKLHYLKDGRAPKAGERMRQGALAGVLRQVAKSGAKAFYEGKVAAEIAATVRAGGGFMEEADLAACTADWVDLIGTDHGGQRLIEIPPNGQGITALIMLNMLDVADAKRLPRDSAERWHLWIEVARLAYAARDAFVSDAATMNTSPDRLLSRSFAETLAARIDPDRRIEDLAMPRPPGPDTTCLTVVDRDRRAVSFINSLYYGMGARIVTPNSGITLQNRGACFTLERGHPNEMAPGKRPMHTIIPGMATNAGKASISFGVMGGGFQPMGHAQVFTDIVLGGMDAQAAADQPRLFWGDDGVLEAETGISAEVCAGLEARGHPLRRAAMPHGGAQIIAIDHESGFLVGGSDPRKDGFAAGW
ncbi:MAG: gamma-glutamyltransferase family protein [Rhizobiaceae bacterium]|nr:gamma-glutamyltransferase family protein [Rhizobiaceae bacterium]